MFRSALSFIKREAVLSAAAALALLSMFLVPPDAQYAGYIDWNTLALLFSLMAVMKGYQRSGLFDYLGSLLLGHVRSTRGLLLVLVFLPFVFSMVITNDVSLITFVPFTVLLLSITGQQKRLIPVIVLQTVAANLGSMLTPIGNPQNLFLCSYYGLSIGAFLRVVLPLTIVSLLALSAAALWTKGETIEITFPSHATIARPRLFALLCGLFVLCLLSVVHVLHYGILTVIVVLCLALFARGLFARVDYLLLLTFVCFFIFAGNMGRIDAVRAALEHLLNANAYWTSVLASQVISNVPAAVLLSGFTDQWQALLAGVNVGGLGTPIASLASLISLKLYLRDEHASLPHYLGAFTLANVAGLLLLSGAAFLFGCTG